MQIQFMDNLRTLFNPHSVAVIGASENPGKLGFHIMKSLTQGGFKGPILPVNPGAREIMGIPAYARVTECGGHADLAVIVLPAKLVPEILKECHESGVKGIVLITAGFKEIDDPAGGRLQDTLAKIANSASIPVIGPNTFGMINLHSGLNASFTPEFSLVKKGGVSLVCQSGGISHLLAFRAIKQNVGISKIIGLGNRLNVDFAQVLPFLMEDIDTNVILLYLEGLDDPRGLMETAEKCRWKKPVVALKAGHASKGDLASLSHTGTIAGRGEIYQGAMRQAGIFPVESSEALLDLGHVLSSCPFPQGPRIAILTGQAGPGMLACDICEAEGLETATFRPETQAGINALLPPLALRTNPVDMGPGWYNSSAIYGIVRAVMEDENVDGILLLMMFASANGGALAGLSPLLLEWRQRKPIVGCLTAPPGIWDQELDRLEGAGAIINLPTPERAARMMAYLWQYRKILGKT